MDGNSDTEIRRWITARANAWRKVEGVMGDRWISHKLKEKELNSCVTPAYMYGLEMTALTEKEQKVHICIINWIRRIVGESRGWSEGKI